MPRSIRVGPHVYTVRIDDAAVLAYQADSNDSISAFSDLAGHRMVFASNADQPVSALHEALHVIFNNVGLNIRLGSEREEDVIQSIDHALVGLIRDNPGLVRFLTEA